MTQKIYPKKSKRATNCVTVSLAAASTLLTRTVYSGAPIDHPELGCFRVYPSDKKASTRAATQSPDYTWIEHELLAGCRNYFFAGPYSESEEIRLSQDREDGIPMYLSEDSRGDSLVLLMLFRVPETCAKAQRGEAVRSSHWDYGTDRTRHVHELSRNGVCM